MKLYVVEYVVRSRRSIGKTHPMEIIVEARNEAKAKEIAYQAFQQRGFDTWQCQSIRLATPEEIEGIRENTL